MCVHVCVWAGAGGGASGFRIWVGGSRLGVWFRRVNDAGQFKDFK